MIIAGLLLLAVGAVDLVRQFVPRHRRWIGFLITVIVLLLIGSVGDALLPMFIALAVGAVWLWLMPDDRALRAGFWPAIALAALAIGAVVWFDERTTAGLIGEVWHFDSPFGEISFDLAILTLGALAFVLESGNVIVRAALDGENSWRPAETSSFQGGRLIGPLERVIVVLLTLAGAYPLLAAMLAAKGIVRFPEISRDGETGGRAEYFLVGSLVSWVIALAAAFLIWWSAMS